MVTKKCVQCGKEFTLSDGEVDFYIGKGLNLPKRCKQCRNKNKSQTVSTYNAGAIDNKHGNSYKSYYINKINYKFCLYVIIAALSIALYAAYSISNIYITYAVLITVISIAVLILFVHCTSNKIYIKEFDTSIYKYTFYDTASMVKHYVKHGDEVDCESMEQYLFKVNYMLSRTDNLSRTQADGDKAYFNRDTCEFAVIAKAGYVRTYFIANSEYFFKQ